MQAHNRILGIYQKHNPEDFPLDNVFNVNAPSAWGCYVFKYIASHGYLKVHTKYHAGHTMEAYQAGAIPFYLVFRSVLYFQGPMKWETANFQVLPPAQCVELVRKCDSFDILDDQTLLAHYTLFGIDTPNFEIRLLAGSFKKIELHSQKEYIDSVKY